MKRIASGDPLHALGAWVASDPEQASIDLDRYIVAKGGLRAFIPLAWSVIEGPETGYKGNWHIDAICEHLQAVSDGELRRLCIAIPPRHMKSVATAVSWPSWDWIGNPWRRFMFASYAHNLSIRDSVRCRRIVSSPWFQARWGDRFRITSDQNTKIRFENDRNGYRLSTSVGGQLTGEGADIIAIDDPHNVMQAESEVTREGTLKWWSEAMSTRLNDPRTGAYVLIQQRVHEGDLMGHVLRETSEVPWTYLCLPAEYEPDHPHRWFRDPRKELGELIWPERFGAREVADTKRRLGPYAAAGQLQQRPAPREGGIFKKSWFGNIAVAPSDTRWVRAWDFAASEKKLIKSDPDWTATAKVGWSASLQNWIIGEIQRDRMEAHAVERWVLNMAEADGPRVVIQLPQDPGQAGKAQAQNFLALLSRYTVFTTPVTGDKMTRALAWAGKAGGGMVKLVTGEWTRDFLAELGGFPTGAHDDQVDAVSSAFERLADGVHGIMDYYAQELAALGVDISALKAPIDREREEEEARQAAALALRDGGGMRDALAATLG